MAEGIPPHRDDVVVFIKNVKDSYIKRHYWMFQSQLLMDLTMYRPEPYEDACIARGQFTDVRSDFQHPFTLGIELSYRESQDVENGFLALIKDEYKEFTKTGEFLGQLHRVQLEVPF